MSIRDAAARLPRKPSHLHQLSDRDAVFLSVERPEAPSHFAGLAIVDPSGSPGFSYASFVEILRERLDLVARFRWKLFEPPLGIDRAYWVEDDAFDITQHIHRVAVPEPGDRGALARLVAFLHAQSLDRARPLWECWWIESLPDGRVAVLMKVHHCLMDGESGMGFTEMLMDVTPEPVRHTATPDSSAEEEPEAGPRRPELWEIGRAAVSNNLRIPQAIAIHSRRALAEGLNRTFDTRGAKAPPPVPRVRFNGRLSRQRAFAFASIPLGPLRDAKKHFDVKMNDVLLEIVASSLRRGLRARGELPDEAIVALCPVSLRTNGDQSFGNQISSMPVSLATHVEDLPRRLRAIHASAEAAKRRLEGGAFETLAALGECLAPGVLRWLTGVAHAMPSLLPLPANLVISNVRGLPVPMYLAGARVEEFYPLSMLQVANGMNVTAVSHEDQVDFGFLVDSGLIRDPWIYADGVHAAVRELEEAVASNSKARMDVESSRPEAVEILAEEKPDPPRVDDADDRMAPPIEDESEPLDLRLVMAGLTHLPSPPRHPHPSDEASASESDDAAN